jgi:hypothetical protein
MTLRVYLTDFALANPLYAGATVEVFEVNQNLANTGVYATVYAGPTGPALRANPITLDSDGKYPGLHYVEKPVIQRVTRGTEQLELGVHGLVPRWRGVWTGATLYYVGERVRHPTDPVTYVCRSSHISANFAADLAANLWQEEFDADTIADAVSAGLIGGILPNTPETFLRVAPGGTAIEGRTAAQVRGDLSVLTQAQLESGYARLAFANVFTQPQRVKGDLRVDRDDTGSEGGRLISRRASDNADGYFWQTFGAGSTPAFRLVKAFGTPAQIFTISDSGAVTMTGPLTLPASNPTDPNHATRKAYVDAEIASAIASLPTASVLAAIAGAGVGAVGTYAFAYRDPAGYLPTGDTVPGSQLRYANDGGSNAEVGYSHISLPGTWRLMGAVTFRNGQQDYGGSHKTSLWLRIA